MNTPKEKNNNATYTHIAAVFDSFAYTCPHFTAKTNVNNGYGCYHKNNLDGGVDNAGQPCGTCGLGYCPLGYSADDECLNNPAIDWQGGKPAPGDIEDEYIIVAVGSDSSDEEREAADKYVHYINRYTTKEEM